MQKLIEYDAKELPGIEPVNLLLGKVTKHAIWLRIFLIFL